MKDITFQDANSISGGFLKAAFAGFVSALTFALGTDLDEVWNEGWNDPYGKD